jgi:O-antigen/teichoic acid export membrane protein
MFLSLARAMPPDAFGQLGFAFSLATLLSLVGSFGQRTLVLRYASIYSGNDDNAALSGLLRYGYRNIVLGGVIVCAGLALSVSMAGQGNWYLIIAGPLAMAMSIAEYQAHFLRACGRMVRGLTPRDIVWRLVVIIVALVALGPLFELKTASAALVLLTLSLAVVSVVQLIFDARMRSMLRGAAPKIDGATKNRWRHTAIGLWGTSVMQGAGPNLAVVMLGLLLTPAQTGPFFSALRIAMVLSLFLMAANMAAASVLARSYADGDGAALQRTCTFVARMVMLPTLAGFLLFVIFGGPILRLFGDGFDSAHTPLVILSFGYAISALAGPTVQVMETTGHERTYLRILTVSTCITLALMPVAIHLAGVVGAAAMIAGNMIIVRLLCYRFILRTLGIASSVFATGMNRLTQ